MARTWRCGCLALLLPVLLVGCDSGLRSPGPDGRWPLAVVGDSDSHAYHDRLSFPAGSGLRGGGRQARSYNWHELIGRLRGDEVDAGAWGVRGTRGRIARLLRAAGIPARSPRKQDHAYNFAVSGAGCSDLLGGHRQVPGLLAMMDAEPDYWRRGVVVVRIGINDIGTLEALRALAADPADPGVRRRIGDCVRAIEGSVALLHGAHPDTRVVLVGLFDNTNWARYADVAWTPRELANVDTGLDAFDGRLRALARADPRIAFFDDRAWFRMQFGGRDAAGDPDYRALRLSDGLVVENTSGDAPSHATLADGHAGTAWNGRWAEALLGLVRDTWRLRATPITDEEIVALAGPPGP